VRESRLPDPPAAPHRPVDSLVIVRPAPGLALRHRTAVSRPPRSRANTAPETSAGRNTRGSGTCVIAPRADHLDRGIDGSAMPCLRHERTISSRHDGTFDRRCRDLAIRVGRVTGMRQGFFGWRSWPCPCSSAPSRSGSIAATGGIPGVKTGSSRTTRPSAASPATARSRPSSIRIGAPAGRLPPGR